ncbi:4Fe-4S ferredoxin [Synergistales bacterium]|nr:4Fe-4S ferredoxin [Synergistales bacterium]
MAEILTKEAIVKKALAFGAEFVGFALLSEKTADWAQTVITLGVPLLLPILDTTPSVWGLEQEKITAGLLLKTANRVSAFLIAHAEKAVRAELSDEELVRAGYCAGLGAVGKNRRLVTDSFGPRVKLTAVLTSFRIPEAEPEKRPPRNPCVDCDNCVRICPVGALDSSDDASRCASRERELKSSFKNPCAACLKVCPVGLDRKLYQSYDFQKYFDEKKTLDEDPSAKRYSDWVHVRSYGSYPHRSVEDTPFKGKTFD